MSSPVNPGSPASSDSTARSDIIPSLSREDEAVIDLIKHQPGVEDQGPTTDRELWGWFSYAWAAEPFIVSAVGTYVPILLEQFARDNAVRVDDYNIPCGAPKPGNGHHGDDSLVPPGDIKDPAHSQKCVVPIFGHYYIDTSSFALYTFSFSVFVQTLVVISMSGAADRGKFRKKLLVWFAVIGALSTCAFLTVTQTHYLVCAILAIISNSSFGAVSVCGNSFLPVLVRNHPDVLDAIEKVKKILAFDNSPSLISLHNEPPPEYSSTPSNNETHNIRNDLHSALEESVLPSLSRNDRESELLLEHEERFSQAILDHPLLISTTSKLSGTISGRGVALGYASALLVQLSTILLIKMTGASTFSLKLAIFSVGVWWLIFQIPVILLLRSRPGPPLPKPKHILSHKSIKHRIRRFLTIITNGGYGYIVYGWLTLFTTFKEARQMKDVAIFLLAWFMISDAATTINSAAVLFAKTELQMTAPSLAVIGVMVVCFGILGATLMPKYIAPRLGSNPVRGIMLVVFFASLIPAYGMLGFYTVHFGLRSPWEMYVLAAWYGFSLGGLNTLCRSVFSLLIPRGKETTFFSLFSVTDKGSSILGPFVTGLITDKTHNIRYTFYFLFFLMLAPIGILYNLDVERGRREALFLEFVEADEDDVED